MGITLKGHYAGPVHLSALIALYVKIHRSAYHVLQDILETTVLLAWQATICKVVSVFLAQILVFTAIYAPTLLIARIVPLDILILLAQAVKLDFIFPNQLAFLVKTLISTVTNAIMDQFAQFVTLDTLETIVLHAK